MIIYLADNEILKPGFYRLQVDKYYNHQRAYIVEDTPLYENDRAPFMCVSDIREIVFCKDCIHRPLDKERPDQKDYGIDVEFPLLDDECPYHCGDPWYNERPKDNWFCHKGEKANGEEGEK